MLLVFKKINNNVWALYKCSIRHSIKITCKFNFQIVSVIIQMLFRTTSCQILFTTLWSWQRFYTERQTIGFPIFLLFLCAGIRSILNPVSFRKSLNPFNWSHVNCSMLKYTENKLTDDGILSIPPNYANSHSILRKTLNVKT